ncbi:GNAT family N-acetyltransferase [Sphingobium aquiterrae]|uniref:GNAT family N-acetyltransferase n=1 Tax=Sphingobium aquiterrae TaxID=2038656 RepID=UPI0030172929
MIRPARSDDADGLWRILEPVIRAGETLAIPRAMTREDAIATWLGADRETFVLEEDSRLLGLFYIRANQAGGGAHVANAGYVTAADALGRGVARRMCAASLEIARQRGFRAMQFNFVISTNSRAVALWEGMGFAIVGRLPAAFDHPALGLVDALVMHRSLID